MSVCLKLSRAFSLQEHERDAPTSVSCRTGKSVKCGAMGSCCVERQPLGLLTSHFKGGAFYWPIMAYIRLNVINNRPNPNIWF